ncbi:MAG: phenylalanine--tRNA ligase subunit beta [Planctomycetes bacterium]|nr:phenylalanine--tRNA ligase subunit beta [Planctomycetota bacterium]
MDASLNWLNRCLDRAVSADEAERYLTQAGLPLESVTPLPGGDVRLDVEVTSNRGDCLAHVGLAREIAACGGIGFKRDTLDEPTRTGDAADSLKLHNQCPDACPLFTAQVIRGVSVGPSPEWLVTLLEAVGQRSINNVVDVTNFLTLHFGQPAHVFDLHKLAGNALVIRFARDGERLTTLDGKDRRLRPSDLVVADADRAQSLAGIIGGFDSQVADGTTDVVLEAACWDPVTIRTTVRCLNIRTDASHRFERGVDARTVEFPARFAAAMIVELAGGELLGGSGDGILADGPPQSEPIVIDLRPSRCRAIIGVDYTPDEIVALLTPLEIEAERADADLLRCTIPAFRLDLTREVDLIEEVARTGGFDRIDMAASLPIRITHPQESERNLREIATTLTGLGFYETVTISFISPDRAGPFLDPSLTTIEVDDERRRAEPTLRPSVLPSLLACRKANQDARVSVPGGVRLFETAAVFAQTEPGRSREQQMLTMLMDVPGVGAGKRATPGDVQHAVRLLRGAIESLVRGLAGPDTRLAFAVAAPTRACWDQHVFAAVHIEDGAIGELGLIADETTRAYDLAVPVVGAELSLEALLELRPSRARVRDLPAFPGIERDLSVVVPDSVAWEDVRRTVHEAGVDRLDDVSFVGVYRGQQVPAGRKSLTLRLSFRDPARTLQHDEVDPQVAVVVAALESSFDAKLRA